MEKRRRQPKKKTPAWITAGIPLLVLLAAVFAVLVMTGVIPLGGKTPADPASTAVHTDAPAGTGADPAPSGDPASPADTKAGDPAQSDAAPTDPVPAAAEPLNEADLRAVLRDSLKGLKNDWQVVVMDPEFGTRVDVVRHSADADEWMKADGMVPVFVMGAVYQQLADGKLTEDQVKADLEAMIVRNDGAAADRLTALLGGGDAAQGMEAVKAFAEASGLKLGYNRTLAGSGEKPNYVTALQMTSILDKLCKGELVSKEASAEMLDLLFGEKDDAIDPGIRTAGAKYGFVSYAEDKVCAAAMGVVRLPNRDYAGSVICNDPEDLAAAKEKVTELLGIVNSYFDGTAEPRSEEPVQAGFTTVDETYFSDALFIGDSLTDGLRLYHPIGDAKFFCGTSMTTYKILDADVTVDGYVGLRALLQGETFGKVYIMLSINEVGNNNEGYISGYKKIVDLIRETQPDALIYIQSVLYVTQEHAIKDPVFKTENIQEKNNLLKELTNGVDILYLEVNDAINDGTDHMVAEYTGDGVHFKAKYYALWADYLMENAWVDENHPWDE